MVGRLVEPVGHRLVPGPRSCFDREDEEYRLADVLGILAVAQQSLADPEHHRAFLSCEGNELMTVFDLDKHAPIAFLKMPGGPDVIKFDPGLGRIYVACYSGAIAVFHQDDPDHYRKLEDFRVQHAVHTVAIDLKTHRLYTPEQEEDGKPVARMVVYEAVTNC